MRFVQGNEFEIAVEDKPSVFESLKFFCSVFLGHFRKEDYFCIIISACWNNNMLAEVKNMVILF